MYGSCLLVEYSSNINNVIKQTFQSMKRIKLVSFNVSPSFLVFGATSGGIYIFKRQPCEFLKLIPSKEGSANLIAISEDEKLLGIASSRGFILILENFIEESNLQYQLFSEHEGRHITCIKWLKHQLYVGDNKGKVSVIFAETTLFQTKSIFQVPTATLMTLDSSIVQIDCFQCYILISTKSKTYLCNTEKECFIQIGKKLRDGNFGACFLSSSTQDLGEYESLVQGSGNPFRSAVDSELIISNSDVNINTKILCARPGARLWEVGFDATVLFTYQFKTALNSESTEILVIGCEEESVLVKRPRLHNDKIPDSFNFQTLYGICDKFLLTYDSERIYIFDFARNNLAFWATFCTGIKHVGLINNNLYVWTEDLEIVHVSVVELEHLLLTTLYKKQYYLCADICLEFKAEVLKCIEHSKKLYLLSALKSRISSADILQPMQPIFDKISESNVKILNRQQKGNIVLVENLHCNEEILPKKSESLILVEDTSADLQLILKQYKLNQTHSTVDIPEVNGLMSLLSEEQLFEILKKFRQFVAAELDEDATDWCQLQYLKQLSQRNSVLKDLNDECFNFITDALIKENTSTNYSCACGYPLPKCHKEPPKFLKTALDAFEVGRNNEKLLKNIPYLWRRRIKSETYGLNIMALVQFNDLSLLKEHTNGLIYDNWHDILGYFIKINKGFCLNCDRNLDVTGVITWSDLAKLSVLSLGSKNTIRILEKYEKEIPKGALDATFYQTCIFVHTFVNDNNSIKVNPDGPFKFLEGLNSNDYAQLQETMAKYFKRKYASSRNPCYTLCSNNNGLCSMCNLPLKNDILLECETDKRCGHRFHKFCFSKSGQQCSICG